MKINEFPPRRTLGDRLRFDNVWVAQRLTLSVLAAMLAMFLFVQIAHEVGEQETRAIDFATMHYFHTHQPLALHVVMKGISWLAGPIGQTAVLCLCVGGFAVARRFWPEGITLLFSGAGGVLLIMGLKRLFHRPRPEVIFAHLGYSFPSGHSFFALTVYGMFAYWLAKDAPPHRRRVIWTVAVLAIFLVGFSRVFLGEHFPTDVAAGYAVALPWLWGCLALSVEFRRKKRVEQTASASGAGEPAATAARLER